MSRTNKLTVKRLNNSSGYTSFSRTSTKTTSPVQDKNSNLLNLFLQDKNFELAGEMTVDAPAACGMMSYCVPYTSYPLNKTLKFADDAHLARCPMYTNFTDIPTIFGKVIIDSSYFPSLYVFNCNVWSFLKSALT